MPHDRERERQINAIEAQLARHARWTSLVLAGVTVLGGLILALLLTAVVGIRHHGGS